MFPSYGFFSSINCPDYLERNCIRPYCHYLHDEKLQLQQEGSCSESTIANDSGTDGRLKTTSLETGHRLQTSSKKQSEGCERRETIGISCNRVINTLSTKVSDADAAVPKASNELSALPSDNRLNEANIESTAGISLNEGRLNSSDTVTNVNSNDNSGILQQLISEAVKKVLSENSKLSSTLIDPGVLIEGIDTNSLITKAVKEISDNAPSEDSAKEKWQPRLYLPPPGIPSYSPTPINVLKRTKSTELYLPNIDEEYTPTPINSACQNYEADGEITDFSDDDDTGHEVRSEFDMLEEVLVEQTVDPARKKAILKRKKALGKLSSTIVVPKSQIPRKNINTVNKPSINESAQIEDDNDSYADAFRPPSPIFTSSSSSNIAIPSEFKRNLHCDASEKGDCFNITKLPLQHTISGSNESSSDPKSNEICSTISSSKVSSHNLLPKIAGLSRPNLRSWTPVAKVDSLLSVEKMLEQLDSIQTVAKSAIEDNLKLKPNVSHKSKRSKELPQQHAVQDASPNNPTVSQKEALSSPQQPAGQDASPNKPTVSQKEALSSNKFISDVVEKPSGTVNDKYESTEDNIVNENDRQQPSEKSETESNNEFSCKKRSYDSDESYERKRKKKKLKKSHHRSKSKHKKHKRRDSSADSDSFSESYGDDSSEYYDSDSERGRKKSKRNKHKKRKRKSSHHRKSKHKHKKSKDYKSKRKRSRSETPSGKDSDSASKSENSESVSKQAPAKVLLSEADIKKEKLDADISIVKIEYVGTQNENKLLPSASGGVNNEKPAESSSLETRKPPEDGRSTKMKSNLDKKRPSGSSTSSLEVRKPPVDQIPVPAKEKPDSKQIPPESSSSSLATKKQPEHRSKEDSVSSKRKPDNTPKLSKVKDKAPVNINTKDCRLGSPPVQNMSMFDIVAASPSKNSKPKVLTEFSMFEGLKEPSKKKISKRRESNSENSATDSNKQKRDVQLIKIVEKRLETEVKSNTATRSNNKDQNVSSKDKASSVEKSKHSSHKSSYSHSPHKRRDKEKKESLSDKGKKNQSESKSSKESDRHRERSHSHSSKSKSDSKHDLKHKSSSSHRKSDHSRVNIKSEEVHKIAKDAKVGENSKETKADLRSLEMEEMLTGSESPIPDLSALDDLPKEDWDQLLSNANDKIPSSDTDEGIDFDADPFDVSLDNEDVEDPRILEECMKVFSEYKPEDSSRQPVSHKKDPVKNPSTDQETPDVPTRKSRVAYTGAAGNLIPKSKALIKPVRKTPAQVMLERYEKLKAEEMVLQKKLELQRKQLEKHGKIVPPTSALSSGSTPALSSSSVSSTTDLTTSYDDVTSTSTGMLKKRIARAPSNVSAMLKSKEALMAFKSRPTIPTNAKQTTSEPEEKTVTATNAKGTKRIAHTPKLEALERPIVSMEEGTKLPQNIRQRYLNCFIDETLKFCVSEEHAYNVGLAEESICHKRAPGRMVYLNLAVNVLKKLRAGQISEAAQELLECDPKYKCSREKTLSSPPSVSSSSATAKKSLEHPLNPNHRTVSHFSVMAQGGQKGSWSIVKSKRSLPDNINDYLTGKKFYESLEKYILSIEELEENCFPRPDPKSKGRAILKKINNRKKISPSEHQRYCDRCSILYEVDQWGLPVISVSCVYHWGRAYKRRGCSGFETRYSCCQGDSESGGCCLGTTHVSENFTPDSLRGYVRTIPKEPDADGFYGIFALDCEMSYTTGGSALTRITVVDTSNKTVYETLVKPDNPIIDYNTRFSGITEGDLENVCVTLRDVQAALLTRFSEKTILMGHSLESDFTALKLIHDTVVDTSVVFPHRLGSPYKRALRNLASEYLCKIIQNGEKGHDSAEDAITCMQLMHWKIKEDLKEKKSSTT